MSDLLICNTCNEEKCSSEFSVCSSNKRGHHYKCKKCSREYNKLYRISNIDYLKKRNKEYRDKEGDEKTRARNKKYKDENKDKIKITAAKWKSKNSDRIRETSKAYAIKNADKKRAWKKDWDLKNADKRRAYVNKRQSIRKKIDPLFRLKCDMRNLILSGFNRIGTKKKTKGQIILGCSYEYFKKYIESLWEPWMNWENKGNSNGFPNEPNMAWDVDHIVPLCTAKNEEDVIRLNHYKNLRPLCAFDNRFIKRQNEKRDTIYSYSAAS